MDPKDPIIISDKPFIQAPTILIVEDKEPQMNYLHILLKKLKINVIATNNASKAIDLANIYEIDCVLLDIHLGREMTGIEIMTTLRKSNKYANIPIIAITAYYGYEHKNDFLDAGFDDYIAKPYNFEDLKEILDNHLYESEKQYKLK